eukprot:14029294-Ditylum_brightwellii.AAC.1
MSLPAFKVSFILDCSGAVIVRCLVGNEGRTASGCIGWFDHPLDTHTDPMEGAVGPRAAINHAPPRLVQHCTHTIPFTILITSK